MNMEQQPQEQSLENTKLENENPLRLKEKIFLSVVFDKLIDTFEDDLYDAGAEEEDIRYFRDKVSHRSQEEILGVLSLPKDIRNNLFHKAFTKEAAGNVAIDSIVSSALDGYHKYGYTLGYHVSDKEIVPTKNGWNISPTEVDDRDDMKMAYYSVDYEHFYRKKPAKYIYFVRAETGENSSHKKDTSSRWSRAVSLSVVDKVPLAEVDELVEKTYKEALKKRHVSEME
jgi:hypothetical protein